MKDFYTVLIDDNRDEEALFVNFEDAERYIEKATSWDCRPNGGDYSEWYDPKTDRQYRIVECNEQGEY